MAKVTIHVKSWYEIEVPDHVAEKGNFAIMDYVARRPGVTLENISLDNGVLYGEVVDVV